LLYRSLGKSPADSYRLLFSKDDGQTSLIREAIQGSWVLGTEKFKEMAERKSGCHVAPLPRGGDRKVRDLKGEWLCDQSLAKVSPIFKKDRADVAIESSSSI